MNDGSDSSDLRRAQESAESRFGPEEADDTVEGCEPSVAGGVLVEPPPSFEVLTDVEEGPAFEVVVDIEEPPVLDLVVDVEGPAGSP